MNILLDGEIFDNVQKDFDLGQGVMSFGYKEGGSWITCLPISNALFRENHPTKAKILYKEWFDNYNFIIIDDWGDGYNLKISKEIVSKHWIKKQIENAILLNLMGKECAIK